VSELAKVLLCVKKHEHFQGLIFRKINSLTNSERSRRISRRHFFCGVIQRCAHCQSITAQKSAPRDPFGTHLADSFPFGLRSGLRLTGFTSFGLMRTAAPSRDRLRMTDERKGKSTASERERR